MRYLKQTTFNFILCGILGIFATLGGCTVEDGTDSGNGTGSSRVPLSIRATANGFDGLPETEKGDTPLTRTPVENGNTTTFSNGDAIGIFAIKNKAIADDISNAKLTYSASADGAAGNWNPEAGTTLYWYEGVSYVAYYPYKDGITIDATQTTEQIIASLAAHSSLQPTTDQSSSDGNTANYTACDLMTASGTPTADGGNPTKPILTLNFEHQFALLVLEPQAYMTCTAPADGGFVYRANSKAPATDPNVKSATINSVSACQMSDGTYRILVKPTADASQLTGSYLTSTDNKKVSFSGSSIATGFAAGHCYKVAVVRSTPNTTNSVERALAPGDFVFHGTSGIEVYPGNGLLTEDGNTKIPDYNDAVGIVVTCDKSRMTDEECNNKGWSHAYVMGLYQEADCGWGPGNVNETVLPDSRRDIDEEGVIGNMNGYTESEAMLAERKNKGDLNNYGVFKKLDTYRTNTPVPDVLSGKRSPWFLGSVGQWFDVFVNLGDTSPKDFKNNTIYNWVDENGRGDIWNKINSQLNKINKPLTNIYGNTSVSYWCSSEEEGPQMAWESRFGDSSVNWDKVYVGYGRKVASITSKYAFRPFFAF